MTGLVAALDVGGTKLLGALLDDTGIRHRVQRPTPGPPGAGDPGSAGLRALVADLAGLADEPVLAVGSGWCEYVDGGRLTSREVLAWTEQPADWLPRVLPGARVVVESDVRCGLLAESLLGATRGLDSAAFVSWGTGISSALLINGRPWGGARGRAIALGELPVAPAGCRLEPYASGAGMAARWSRSGAAGGQGGGARQVLLAAAADDPVAARIATTAGAAVADGLNLLSRLVDPQRIVLGGGLGSADSVARRAVADRWAALGAPAELVWSTVGPDGPLLGAAVAAGWRPAGEG